MSTTTQGGVLQGRYRIDGQIGKGGFGVVYAATDLTLGRQTAIKVLVRAHGESHAHERFLLEARATARLESEHIPRIYDVGLLDSGEAFIAMELLRGTSLHDEMERRGRMSVSEAASIVGEACLGVAVAHAAGIVHRDLKPQNVFLSFKTDGTRVVKVLDFGIARDLSGPRLTQSGAWLGTPAYMSPEQVGTPELVGPASDIWALGVLLYELVSGAPIFDAKTPAAHAGMLLTETALELRQRDRDIPQEFAAVVHRCLERAPGERFLSALALAEALEPFRIAPSRRADQPTLEPLIAASTKSAAVGASRRKAGPRFLVAGALGGGLLSITGVAWWVITRQVDDGTSLNDQQAPSVGTNSLPAPALAGAAHSAAPSDASGAANGLSPSGASAVAASGGVPSAAVSVAQLGANPAAQSSPSGLSVAAAKPATTRPSEAEFANVHSVCMTYPAPLFLVPGNDGAKDTQCRRLAGLGCRGIKGGCFREANEERKLTCRNFVGGLTASGACP